jgi:hypothetical protein
VELRKTLLLVYGQSLVGGRNRWAIGRRFTKRSDEVSDYVVNNRRDAELVESDDIAKDKGVVRVMNEVG